MGEPPGESMIRCRSKTRCLVSAVQACFGSKLTELDHYQHGQKAGDRNSCGNRSISSLYCNSSTCCTSETPGRDFFGKGEKVDV